MEEKYFKHQEKARPTQISSWLFKVYLVIHESSNFMGWGWTWQLIHDPDDWMKTSRLYMVLVLNSIVIILIRKGGGEYECSMSGSDDHSNLFFCENSWLVVNLIRLFSDSPTTKLRSPFLFNYSFDYLKLVGFIKWIQFWFLLTFIPLKLSSNFFWLLLTLRSTKSFIPFLTCLLLIFISF